MKRERTTRSISIHSTDEARHYGSLFDSRTVIKGRDFFWIVERIVFHNGVNFGTVRLRKINMVKP